MLLEDTCWPLGTDLTNREGTELVLGSFLAGHRNQVGAVWPSLLQQEHAAAVYKKKGLDPLLSIVNDTEIIIKNVQEDPVVNGIWYMAALKSRRISRVTSCLSMLISISLWTLKRAVSVKRNLRYADWFVGSRAQDSQYANNWLRAAFSVVLDTKERLLTGRKFANSASSQKRFSKGLRCAIFHDQGKWQSWKDRLIIVNRRNFTWTPF